MVAGVEALSSWTRVSLLCCLLGGVSHPTPSLLSFVPSDASNVRSLVESHHVHSISSLCVSFVLGGPLHQSNAPLLEFRRLGSISCT